MRQRELTIPVGDLELECGETLPAVEQHVTIYGEPNADCSNVVLAPHALTGSSRVAEWWPAIVGENALFDPNHWCVIGINALGGCYGSTGPRTISLSTIGAASTVEKDVLNAFPRITVGDIVRAQQRAIDYLGLEHLALVIGGSLGGMQALQWAVDAPHRINHAVVIGAHDHHSAMGIALNAVQREGLALDRIRGLRLARKIALLTYKSQELLNERHGRRSDRLGQSRFDVEGYLEYQADRFEGRMDAATYATLTHAMDSFDVRNALIRSSNPPRVTFIGISSDWLFRPEDVQAASERFRLRGLPSQYIELTSSHGHDAFLVESKELVVHLRPLLPSLSELAQIRDCSVYPLFMRRRPLQFERDL